LPRNNGKGQMRIGSGKWGFGGQRTGRPRDKGTLEKAAPRSGKKPERSSSGLCLSEEHRK
jgi:hypothetical protein